MTESWVIHGGHRLAGDVRVSGFKHAVPPLVGLALMTNGTCSFSNTPDVEDVRVIKDILLSLGAEAFHDTGARRLVLNTAQLTREALSPQLTGKIHGSMYLVPGLLARNEVVDAGPFGGCLIGEAAAGGERPVQHVADILERFGSTVQLDRGGIRARVKRFTSQRVDMADFAVVNPRDGTLTGPLYSGATKMALLCAATAAGVSEIINPYRKSDVGDLLLGLQSAGVAIEDDGSRIRIEGRHELNAFDHDLVSDAIEIVTYLCMSVYLNAPIRLIGVTERIRQGIVAELACLQAIGCNVQWGPDSVSITGCPVRGTNIIVSSHGVFSDSQPFLALLLASTYDGGSIQEHVWQHRFDYVDALKTLGASMQLSGPTLHISPGIPLKAGQSVVARDLRAAAALVVAALRINGETVVRGVEHLSRGYPDFAGQLRRLGAEVSGMK